MKNKINLLTLIAIAIFFQGCVALFTSKNQKTTIVSETKDVNIKFDDNEYNRDSLIVQARLPYAHRIVVSKPGYKTKTFGFGPSRLNWRLALDLHPIFLMFDPAIAPKKLRLYKRKYVIDVLNKLPVKDTVSKFLIVKETNVDIPKKSIAVQEFKNFRKYTKKRARGTSKTHENMRNNDLIFTEDLNKALITYKYVDTISKVIKSRINTAYITGTIIGFKANVITKESMINAEVNFKWEFFDFYGKKVFETTTESTSDFESYGTYYFEASKKSPYYENTAYNYVNYTAKFDFLVSDAMEYSLINLLNKKEVTDFLKMANTDPNASLEVMRLSNQKVQDSCNAYKLDKATVVVKSYDGEIGSGFFVSDDGYIITTISNMHTKDTIDILYNNQPYKAYKIRSDDETNLCLLKTTVQPEQVIKVPKDTEVELASDIFIIANAGEELNNTVSKGIVSAKRKLNKLDYIQTDASLSIGNSGAPILNDKGEVIGIITSKLSGKGMEGLGFGVSSKYILERLRIGF